MTQQFSKAQRAIRSKRATEWNRKHRKKHNQRCKLYRERLRKEKGSK